MPVVYCTPFQKNMNIARRGFFLSFFSPQQRSLGVFSHSYRLRSRFRSRLGHRFRSRFRRRSCPGTGPGRGSGANSGANSGAGCGGGSRAGGSGTGFHLIREWLDALSKKTVMTKRPASSMCCHAATPA